MTNHKEGRTNGYETTQKSGNTEGMIASNATTNGKEISNFLLNEHGPVVANDHNI